jgi:hypothetical protein
MAAQGTSHASKISRWKLLEGRLRDQLPAQPHLTEAHAELQRLIGEAEELELLFETSKGAHSAASARRKAVIQAGEELRARLAGALHFTLGPKSKTLQEFGLKPRQPGGRRKLRPPGGTPPEPEAPKPEAPKAVQAEE